MMKIRSAFSNLMKSTVMQAFLFSFVLVLLGVLLVDQLVMPIIAGNFTSELEVPNVLELHQEEAAQTLKKAKFNFEILAEERYSNEVPIGHILGQTPVAGRKAKKGRTVLLTLSKGVREIAVPDLRGKSQKQAEISLNRAGLVQGKILKGAHLNIPIGVVIRTEPMADTFLRVGDTVNVVISAGATKGKRLLPDFEGLALEEVFPKLEELGFVSGKITRVPQEGEAPGVVLEHAPKAGDYLSAGTRIDFKIVD
jgi:serine/threonine-protein kinase